MVVVNKKLRRLSSVGNQKSQVNEGEGHIGYVALTVFVPLPLVGTQKGLKSDAVQQ